MTEEEQAVGPGGDEEDFSETIHQTFMTLQEYPRKKFESASEAEENFKRAVLEASAELAYDFNTTYLNKIVTGNLGKKILHDNHAATSYETIKKGFLLYLNGTGKYLVIREHLRAAVEGLLHQKSVVRHARGYKTRVEYQSFLHDSYSFLLDSLNDAIHSTTFEEGPGNRLSKCKETDKQDDLKRKKHLRDLLLYAQEACAQCDYENAHRLHIERIIGSGDSDECWIDFAVMWLGRGDDRLAEIAVREALTRNPQSILGLLIAGLVAGRHRDKLGLSYLEILLKHRPLCPEIHIILATVHSHMGNESAAEPYYQSARKIHQTLTVPKEIPKTVEELEAEAAAAEAELKIKKSDKDNAKGKKSVKGSVRESVQEDTKKKSKRQTRADKVESRPTLVGGKRKTKSDHQKAEETEAPPPKPDEPQIHITKEVAEATKPPALTSCIDVTWNVTKKPKEKLGPPPIGGADDQYKPTKGETTDQVQRKFEKILEAEPEVKGSLASASAALLTHRKCGHPQSHTSQPHHHHHRHHKNHEGVDDPYRNSTLEETSNNSVEPLHLGTPPPDEDFLDDAELFPRHASTGPEFIAALLSELATNGNKNEPPIYSKRFGSEFLWTAHLLLKLRQFEFLDVILAKIISQSETRMVEYLYLRALSLHLRGRDKEALEVIKEELERNPQNGTFWILRGHAYYNLRDKTSALACYQRGMMLPHRKASLHLAYLRMGTICIDTKNPGLAKRVLMKGISQSPSPYLWISVGNACYVLGELDDALYAFSEANKLDKMNPMIWAQLSLVCLAQRKRSLAEQSFKWAIRFGLKNGKLVDDIKDLHKQMGYGNPMFLQIPTCLPHDIFIQRLRRETPMEIYAETLNFPHLKASRNRLDNQAAEDELVQKLRGKDSERLKEASPTGLTEEEEEAKRRGERLDRSSVITVRAFKSKTGRKGKRKSSGKLGLGLEKRRSSRKSQ